MVNFKRVQVELTHMLLFCVIVLGMMKHFLRDLKVIASNTMSSIQEWLDPLCVA